ncbi:AAA family ATPase, partial [Salmonella enterica subsp. enterica serovar Typhimurium]|nr:AAA family ATPase [Salmonella enterica subsp. enterica serovar Typhimurium]
MKGEVRRERLLSRLTAAMDGPWTLTLVSAPAGSGKTRLLSQWAQRLRADPRIHLVWVSLERGEADLPLLRGALERIDDPGLQDALAAVPAVRSATTARALARALREARNRIVLVIDDVHRVEDEHTAQLLSTFVQSAPGT